ncbi:hypothetical protein QQ045_032591 [Rhodiola kirilowii]
MGKRLHSPQTSRIDQLPDDVLLLILSYLATLVDRARTSILSRRWRNLWRSTTCLDFDATTVLPIARLNESQAWYIAWVNKVIDDRVTLPSLPLVKELRIRYRLEANQGSHIDRWINFAIENGVETLHLELSPYTGLVLQDDQYKLSEESWHRVPSGLSNIKYLKSLFLSSVNVSKQFIEFVLSSCPLLEDLSLHFAKCYDNLDVSGVPPLRLRRLKISNAKDFALTKLCAPYLTSLHYNWSKFNPQNIDVPMLTDLTIGSLCPGQPIMKYLEHFWCYLCQLEKLELMISEVQDFRLTGMPQLVKLKYLKIRVMFGDYDSIRYRITNLINTCPLLETLALQVNEMFDVKGGRSPLLIHRRGRKQNGRSFKCLKVLELYGANGKTIDQEVVRFIIRKAPNLEKLTVDIRKQFRYNMFTPPRPDVVKVVESKAKLLCHESCSEIKITVVG